MNETEPNRLALRDTRKRLTTLRFKRVLKQEFADVCKEAVGIRKQYPDAGMDLAEMLTSIWIANRHHLTDSRSLKLFDVVSDLEVPPAHVAVRSGESVEDRWLYLERIASEQTPEQAKE